MKNTNDTLEMLSKRYRDVKETVKTEQDEWEDHQVFF